MPDDDQAMALPCASVIVIIVLLNVAFTCATPDVMFLRSRRRGRCAAAAGLAMLLRYLLLAGDRLGGALAGPGVGVRPLAVHRQSAAMTQPAIASEIDEPLD